jgi:hypothetical protein
MNLVGDQAMRFSVNPFSGCFIWRFHKADNRPAFHIRPVFFEVASYFFSTSRSLAWASATASVVAPSTCL